MPNIYRDAEHPFATYVRILGKGKRGTRSLSQTEAYDAFSMILRGEVLDEQLGAFMMLLRVKEESADELVGFVRATKDHITQHFRNSDHRTIQVDLDWPSYAGKRKHHAWYLLAALTLAKHGIRVLMHGAAGHTLNRVYSEDLLRDMGHAIATDPEQIADALDTSNFCYLPLSAMQPQLQRIMDMRNVFGLRSPIHTLARLINPFDAAHSLQSIFHPAYQPNHIMSAYKLGYHNTVVIKGDGGEFERNPDARSKVMGLRHIESGHISPYTMKLPMLNSKKSPIEDDLSLGKLRAVWEGSDIPQYALQAVTETLALALISLKQADSYHYAISIAQQMWAARHD